MSLNTIWKRRATSKRIESTFRKLSFRGATHQHIHATKRMIDGVAFEVEPGDAGESLCSIAEDELHTVLAGTVQRVHRFLPMCPRCIKARDAIREIHKPMKIPK